MFRSLNQSWLWIALLIASLLSFWIMLSHNASSSVTSKVEAGNPDAYMVNATYKMFNEKGELHARIFSPHMTHYPHNNSAYFLKPRILMYTTKQQPWYVNAEHGRSRDGNAWVYLWGHVVVHQPETPKTINTRITTSTLTVYPNKEIATTNKPVTITRPGSITQAIGLNANFKTGIFKLLSNSEGDYAPDSK
jgi:lipopolysaccharide export system protein LptC